jgi:hypothetical protein
MDCYFGATQLPEHNDADKSFVVSFHILEIGIKFKAPFAAVDPDHGDLAALLALLEFIDSNQKYFSNHTYQIFGCNLKIVNGLNRRANLPPKFTPLVQKAEAYRRKYRFSLEWVPANGNPELDELFD